MKKKKLKRHNRILLARCQNLQGQVDALVATYLKNNPKIGAWVEEERKRQMRKTNAAS